jgi:hypothetical protein
VKLKPDVDLGAARATPSVPIPPPELLERAKRLGAVSAGPANISVELRQSAYAGEPRRPTKVRAKSGPKKPGKRNKLKR